MSQLDAQPASGFSWSSFSRSPTVRVVSVTLVVLGLLLVFQHIPNALRWPLRVLWLCSVGWLVVRLVRTIQGARLSTRKIIFIAIIGGFFYLALHVICHVFIKVMSQRDDRLTTRGMTTLDADARQGIQAVLDEKQYRIFSAELGWTIQPGFKTPGFKGPGYYTPSYSINAQGVRSAREYPMPAPDNDKRILCMGDSFTFGIAVKDEETYPAQAEQLKPGTEWLNFGIPGACLTQAYKRYMLDARAFGGKHVVVGFMTNDAQRTVNVFRPFVNSDAGSPLTKPFAKWVDGKFTIEPNPITDLAGLRRLLEDDRAELRKLLALDYLTWSKQKQSTNPVARTATYAWEVMGMEHSMDVLFHKRLPLSQIIKDLLPQDPYGRSIWKPTSPGFKAICGMFDEFHRQIIADGREPLFVIIPGPLDLDDYGKGYMRQYASLLAHFKEKKYAFLDFLDPLVAKHKDDYSEKALFVRSHYQGHVNRELAEEIIKAMRLP